MLSVEREPVVAGTFYSSNPTELIHQLKECFSEQTNRPKENLSALVVPHAGYVYSGQVAASAYSLIDRNANYDNVFVIGTSHHVTFNGASVYNKGHYKTPLGIVPVNMELANKLIHDSKKMVFNQHAHSEEHTIEVQLPFLQYQMRNLSQIVPIVMGVKSSDDCKSIAESLKPYFNEKNLFIFSTDFSHYPTDDIAKKMDAETADVICNNNPDALAGWLEEENNVTNLYTKLCGWSSVMTLLHLTKENKQYEYEKISYMTSGDVMNNNRDRVVGYQSILVKRLKTESDLLNSTDKSILLKQARHAIFNFLGKKFECEEEQLSIDEELNSAFVSVYVSDELQGCMGRFDATIGLIEMVRELAISAAFEDARFKAIEAEDLKDLKIEISVLTPMHKIDDISEITLGKHGVYLKKEHHKGTFLPQVATKTGWTREELLGHLARDKAHIGWHGWYDAELFVFETIIFSD